MSGILKRKFEEVDGSSPCSSVRESDDELSSSESGDSGDSVNPSTLNHFTPSSILKREKRLRSKNVRFNCVTVYSFGRRQGFTSVPSQGGSTLGMSKRHCNVQQYTLGEFAVEQDRLHREMLRDHLRQEKLSSFRLKMTKNGTVECEEADALTLDDISDDDIDLDNTEVDEYFFLQPLSTKKRRALLRASGVKRIDVQEKNELRAIRLSREDCGCECRIFCDPESCSCSLGGIKCQVDRMSFPCGCTKDGCSNTAGRIEFNPIRVRTHFLQTIMKLELEKNREQQSSLGNGCPLAQVPHPVQYSVVENCEIDSKSQAAVMHFQPFDGLDCQGVEEDDEDEEDDEEEEEDDEEDDDEDDGSSFCSAVTDSSTQSLAPSESDDDDDDDDDEEDNDDDDEKAEGVDDVMGTHTELVPLPSVLCFSDGENQSKNDSYYPATSSVYYQIENHAGSNANQILKTYRDGDLVKNGISLVPYNLAVEQFVDYKGQSEESGASAACPGTNPSVIVCCASSESNGSPSHGRLFPKPRPSPPPAEFHSNFKSPSQDGFVSSVNGNRPSVSEFLTEDTPLSGICELHEECIKLPIVEPVTV